MAADVSIGTVLFRSLSGGPGKQAGCRATRDQQLGVDTIAVR